jgi:hypothetical protein
LVLIGWFGVLYAFLRVLIIEFLALFAVLGELFANFDVLFKNLKLQIPAGWWKQIFIEKKKKKKN